LGEKATMIALTAAGRSRGKQLALELGLADSLIALDDLTSKLSHALGVNGTRLCIVEKIVNEENVFKVYTSETICSAGEVLGSERKCSFTMGAIWGALEKITGKRFQGKHIESVLRGGSHDVFEFTEFGK
jgi:predicted hydrocarbon binding protein